MKLPDQLLNHDAVQYALRVVNQEQIAGKSEFLACKRFFDDIENADEKGFMFDLNKANLVINFFEKIIKHSKGKLANQPFLLHPFQKFFLFNVFGWYFTDGRRRFTESFLEVARKNGKTAFASGIEIFMAGFDGEQGPEIYSAATKRDQAKIVWEQAVQFIKKSPELRALGFRTWKGHIENISNFGTIKPLSRDYDSLDGLNPSGAVIDEYHAFADNGLVEVLQSGMGARQNPHMMFTTTAGVNSFGPCKLFHEMCKSVLNGTIDNERLFIMIFELDEGDDWMDEDNWVKANPGLREIDGVPGSNIINIDFLRREMEKAKNMPVLENGFKTKNLNMWISSFDANWISKEVFDLGNDPINYENLKAKTYMAIDLSAREDLTAVAMISDPDENEVFDLDVMCFMPEESIARREKQDRVPYRKWAAEGFLIITQGTYVDYNVIKRYIHNKLDEGYNIQTIQFDKWNATQIMNDMYADGFSVDTFSQQIGVISEPTKKLDLQLLSGKIRHGGNPVLDWMRTNVIMYQDANDNRKIHKGKSIERVDGWVAAVIAMGGYMRLNFDDSHSQYDEEGLTFI